MLHENEAGLCSRSNNSVMWRAIRQTHDYQANVHEAPVDITRRYKTGDFYEQSTKAVKRDKERDRGTRYDNREEHEGGDSRKKE